MAVVAMLTGVYHVGRRDTVSLFSELLGLRISTGSVSFGTQSDRGDRFAERLMTVAHTARKQGRDVLDLLVACAARDIGGGEDEPAPSLFATALFAA